MTIATDKQAALTINERNSPVDLLEFSGKKRVPLILQAEMAECGLACMAMIATFNGYKLDMAALQPLGDGRMVPVLVIVVICDNRY